MNRVPRCAICERPLPGGEAPGVPASPFCSERCRLIDLGRWLDGSYAIAASGREEVEEVPAGTDDEVP